MDKIVWNTSFSVGVAKLDEQHKQLIDMINTLAEQPDVDVRSETVSELLVRMTDYALLHFKTEEALLAQHHYPELSSQEDEHTAYRLKMAVFYRETISQMKTVPRDILDYMFSWWQHHILVTDMAYRNFLNDRGVF